MVLRWWGKLLGRRDPAREASQAVLARWLNDLSNRQSDLGDRESALRSIEEALTIRRALAAARPDAFRPNLARSLWVLADRLDETGDAPGGLAAKAEAILLKSLAFLR